ncbi:hypothetical protein BpHYR1_000141 [Brachionus plicatilis]|uniref:Uncharacterized protein n=1 Tax=Brachionus plicatilis TaxID=10195 RepID=A0A3M7SCV9_BRAPC|nr:hypothetical protein BpHYR1_000141 [Brachionus plicatilis]
MSRIFGAWSNIDLTIPMGHIMRLNLAPISPNISQCISSVQIPLDIMMIRNDPLIYSQNNNIPIDTMSRIEWEQFISDLVEFLELYKICSIEQI